MSSASLQLGGDNWAAKDGNLLGYQKSSSSSVHIPHEFTFTRGSNLAATRVAANGLIEKGRENLAKNTNWEGASLDTAPTNYTGYLLSNGTFNTTSTEGQIRFTTDSSSRAIVITSTISETGIFTQSVYVDEVYTSIAVIDIINRSANATAIAYYEDGVEITATTNVQAGKRYSILWNKTGAASFRFGSGVNTGKAGDIVLSRPQIEQGLVATELIVSPVGSTGLAGLLEDEPRIDYAGGTASLLLEPQRTNLITQSEYFGGYTNSSSTDEPNATTSPEGLTNATAFLEAATTAQHKLVTSFGFDGTSTYTFSIFAKHNGRDLFIDTSNSNEWGGSAWFDLTAGTANAVLGTANIEDYGNGWYRCIVTGASTLAGGNSIELLTSDGSTNSTTGDITKGVYIYGAQLEQGSYPTSYIPNHSGGSVTRNADDCGGAGTSSTFNATEGVFYAEISTNSDGTDKAISLNNGVAGSLNNRLWMGYSTSNKRVYALGYVNNSFQFALNKLMTDESLFVKIACRYKINDIAFFVNGEKVGTDTSAINFTELTRLDFNIGTGVSGASALYGNVKQVLVFNSYLSDSEIITLTS